MSDGKGNILLTITTQMGPGGFASVAALGQMLLGLKTQIMDLAVDVQNFNRSFKELQIPMDAANEATKGMIGQFNLMANANKLMGSGIVMTGQQYADLNKKLAATAQTMGLDVVESVNRAMDAIQKGEVSTLKEFGIAVEAGKTNAETFAKVMKEVESTSGDAEVKVRDIGDRVTILQENARTAAGTLFTLTGNIVELDSVIDDANDTLKIFNESIAQISKNGEASEESMLKLSKTIIKVATNPAVTAFISAIPFIGVVGQGLGILGATGISDKGLEGIDARLKQLSKYQKNRAKVEGFFGGRKELIDEGETVRRGGGGGKAPEPAGDTMSFTEEEALSEEDFFSLRLERMQAQAAQEQAFYEFRLANDEEFRLEQQQSEMEFTEEQVITQEQRWEMELEGKQREKELQAEHHDWLLENSREYREAQEALDRQAMANHFDATAGMFGDMARLFEGENKKAFNISKAMAMTEAALRIPSSAMGAYDSLIGVPYIGPIIAPIAAGVAAAIQVKQMTKISQMQYKGGAQASTGSSSGSFRPAGTSAPSVGAGATQGGGAPLKQTVVVQLDSNVLMDSITESSRDRDRMGYETLMVKAAS